MTTPEEYVEKKVSDGFAWMHRSISLKVGDHADNPMVRRNAAKLRQSAVELEGEYDAFMKLHDGSVPKKGQGELPGTEGPTEPKNEAKAPEAPAAPVVPEAAAPGESFIPALPPHETTVEQVIDVEATEVKEGDSGDKPPAAPELPELDGDWPVFVEAWYEVRSTDTATVSELRTIAASRHQLQSVLGEKGEASQVVRLRQALAAVKGRAYDGLRITEVIDKHRKVTMYRLEDTNAASTGHS